MITRTPPKKASQRRTAKSVSLPAAVGGWNARDSLADMKVDDAVELINYFPGTTTVMLRKGYVPHTVDVSGQAETLMPYIGGATEKLFTAMSVGWIYENSVADSFLLAEDGSYITTEDGKVIILESGHSPVVDGMSNGRWQYVNFTTPGGSYLCCVNGADRYHVYDGSGWTQDTDGPPYDITGVDSRTLIGINAFKNRLWFVQVGTLKAWYLPVNSIGGAAAALDMSSLCMLGGYLMAMGTWTLDAGYGVDDYAVWITNKGEVLVWRMTDPTDPNSIFLVGIWHIGSPIGRRCMEKWYGDLIVITRDGVVPLSQALQSSRLNQRVAMSDKIDSALGYAVEQYAGNFGWQLLAFPAQSMLILNVPVQEGRLQEQFVMNTTTQAWCRFTGWHANCWALWKDSIYFGGNNLVGAAWQTYSDLSEPITGSILQAFNYFGQPSMVKRFTMMRPTFYCNGAPEIQGNINVDYDQSPPASNLNTIPVQGALWDVDLWDIGQWAADLALCNRWQGANAVGYSGAVRLASSTTNFSIDHVATDVVIEGGEIL